MQILCDFQYQKQKRNTTFWRQAQQIKIKINFEVAAKIPRSGRKNRLKLVGEPLIPDTECVWDVEKNVLMISGVKQFTAKIKIQINNWWAVAVDKYQWN